MIYSLSRRSGVSINSSTDTLTSSSWTRVPTRIPWEMIWSYNIVCPLGAIIIGFFGYMLSTGVNLLGAMDGCTKYRANPASDF